MAKRNTIATYSRAKLDYILDQKFVAASGDITGVTAGNALNGGGTSGTVALAVDISTATDGTGITVASGDLILLADADDSNNVKRIQVSQLTTVQAAGSTGQIQFNNGNSFGASAKFNFDNSTNATLSITGSLQLTGSIGINVRGSDVTHGLTLPNETSDNSGMVKATAYLTYSSRKYKKNIKSMEKALSKLDNLRAVTFDWKDSGKKDIGFIVEEVVEELPEVVGYDSGIPSSMDYAKMTSFLLQCVKEQQEELKIQKKQIEFLRKSLNKE